MFWGRDIHFDFFGETIEFKVHNNAIVELRGNLSQEAVKEFYDEVDPVGFQPAINALNAYKARHKPDDWLFYQLIRKTVQQLSPKATNYNQYTLYKWFFLMQTGYDAIVCVAKDKILLYVQSDENVYNIPARIRDTKQFICLNYHDYRTIDFDEYRFQEVLANRPGGLKGFSYRVTQLPEFNASDYKEKNIQFTYYNNEYQFKVKLNPQVQTIFANYPVVDYASYFNIPLSKQTYSSLIPSLKANVKGLSIKNGVDYLMHFTRNAFIYEKDSDHFGKEKRLSPEETLLYEQSDCDDRAALFFCLVKEIYDLPMIVLAYPSHVTIAVQLDKVAGNAIIYNGNKYYVCEPTPQKEELRIGQIPKSLARVSYEVAYSYHPGKAQK